MKKLSILMMTALALFNAPVSAQVPQPVETHAPAYIVESHPQTYYSPSRGRRGVAAATQAGQVACISYAQIAAGIGFVAAIAIIAILFNHGHAHS